MTPPTATPDRPDHVLGLDLRKDLKIVAQVLAKEEIVDVRLWRSSPSAPTTFRPTSAGFRIPLDRVSEVCAVLRAALRAAP